MNLSDYPYFDISLGDRIEVFINGQSRMVAKPGCSDSRLYCIFVSEFCDEDDLPF